VYIPATCLASGGIAQAGKLAEGPVKSKGVLPSQHSSLCPAHQGPDTRLAHSQIH
jgi:hypothetical protein